MKNIFKLSIGLILIVVIVQKIIKLNSNKNEKVEIQYISKVDKSWITPKSKRCFSSAMGCVSSWDEAKEICSEYNASLPTIEALKKEVIFCKGEIGQSKDIYKKNMNNLAYYFCFKRNGFQSSNSYWSNTEVEGEVKVIHFDSAQISNRIKSQTYYVRCKKNI